MFLFILIVVQVVFTIIGMHRFFTAQKRGYEEGSVWYKNEMDKFTKEQLDLLDKFKDSTVARQNLLSKENARLTEANEKYRDKLKNLGFSDITLDS